MKINILPFLLIGLWAASCASTEVKTQQTTSFDIHSLFEEGAKIDTAWLVVPGYQVGPIYANTSKQDIERMYGVIELVDEEKNGKYISHLFKEQQNHLEIEWTNAERKAIQRIRIHQSRGSNWFTPEGLKAGMEFWDILKINENQAFDFKGFEVRSGLGGEVVSWNGGPLSRWNKDMQVRVLFDRRDGLAFQILMHDFIGTENTFSAAHERAGALTLTIKHIDILLH